MSRVEIDGLERVDAMLTALAQACVSQLDDSINDTADRVAARTRGLMPMGPTAHGHLRESVGIERTAGLHATVSHGGPRYPYSAWLEFGGSVGRHNSVHRTWIRGGRYLYRALSTVKPDIEPGMREGMRQACRETGWNPRG